MYMRVFNGLVLVLLGTGLLSIDNVDFGYLVSHFHGVPCVIIYYIVIIFGSSTDMVNEITIYKKIAISQMLGYINLMRSKFSIHAVVLL